jgi:hypothetical protein
MKHEKSAWSSLARSLEEQQQAIDDVVSKLGGIDKNLDPAFQSSLKIYIEYVPFSTSLFTDDLQSYQ